MSDPVELWLQTAAKLEFRDNLERKLWGDVFGGFDTSRQRGMYDTPDRAADEAVIRMRIRQGTIEKVGQSKYGLGPFGYRVCAVCEGRNAHDEDCPNLETQLPFKFDIPEVE